MNKYQEALDELYKLYEFEDCCQMPYNECIGIEYKEEFDTLQELVSKATPKKPIQLHDKDRHKCPSCGSQLPFRKNALKKKIICCDKCTQMIDWSQEEE